MRISMKALAAAGFMMSGLGQVALASNSVVECVGAAGETVQLLQDSGSQLATLVVKTASETLTFEGVESSFSGKVGSAVKGGDVLFIVSPAQPTNLGELIIEGRTTLLQCR
ncbi:MAG: hypothetical protein NTZ90_17000 [Proteobacteria bacterium]|nr:hypothetical protein [Pseudomonadota bacterium]